jgi:hypothetical protein
MGLLDDVITFKNIMLSALTPDLAISAATVGAMAPFFNAMNAISNRCIAGNVTAHTAYVRITRGGKNPWAVMHGFGKATAQQTIKSSARNALWFKKSEIDEAFPNASDYIIPAYFAASEMLLNPITVALTRTYEKKPYPTTFTPWFGGALPGCLKITANSAIYVRVKPPMDNLMHACGINPNSASGACLSAPLIAMPVTLLTQPLELIRRTQQFVANEHLTFFGVTRMLANTTKLQIQQESVTHAIRFLLRGWAPALAGNITFTIAFNLMILIGAHPSEPSQKSTPSL